MINITLSKFAPVASLAIAGALGLGVAPAPAAIMTDGCASPTECTLEELFDGGSILVGDKLFTEWVSDIDPAIDLSQVIVTPLDDDPLNPGLRYDWGDQLSGGGADLFTGGIFAFVVQTTSPNFLIKDNSLELLDFEVSGDADIVASETPIDLATGNPFVDPDTGENIVKFVGTDPDIPGGPATFRAVDFPPQDAIGVTNGVTGETDTGGTFAIRSIEQRFSQTPIPEESSPWSLMLGIGALGAGSVVSKVLKSKSN